MTIIALAGPAGSGKDTVADIIFDFWDNQRRERMQRIAFAEPLKRFCAEVFDWDPWLLNKAEFKATDDLRYIRPSGEFLTPRFALQTLGTEWGRNCDSDIWVKLALRRAQNTAHTIITDCRFVNEAIRLKAEGAKLWFIVRKKAGLAGEAASHKSETEMHSPVFGAYVTRYISNNGTLDELRAKVAQAMDEDLGTPSQAP